MKRKIRTKRMLHLEQLSQNRKRKKEYEENLTFQTRLNEKLEKALSMHPYMELANSPDNIFVYINFHSGWETKSPVSMVLLYESTIHKISYSSCHLQMKFNENNDFSYNLSYQLLGTRSVETDVNVENMINCNPVNVPRSYDSSFYQIFFKSKQHKRLIIIKTSNLNLYEPFKWIINFFQDINAEKV